jgi:hypothetical protein
MTFRILAEARARVDATVSERELVGRLDLPNSSVFVWFILSLF